MHIYSANIYLAPTVCKSLPDYGGCKDVTQFAGKLLSQHNSLKNHLLSTILGKRETIVFQIK